MPEQGRFRLTVRSEFSASHSLRCYRGKCENLHGHNFKVSVTVEGATLSPDTELLLDFHDIKRELKAALDPLDHAHLNAVPPFDKHNPSSENLARHLYQQLVPRLTPLGVALVSVTVGERDSQEATYFVVDG
jgi:6-pyruvoyltetrahydropterin/6-carboxytetrahydropterin synthase